MNRIVGESHQNTIVKKGLSQEGYDCYLQPKRVFFGTGRVNLDSLERESF